MKPLFSIIGCGRLGTSLGVQLIKAGYPVSGLASKSISTAKKAGIHIGTDIISDKPEQIAKKSKLVFITTPDDTIEIVCKQIAKNGGFSKDSIVIHCSGSLSSSILSSAKDHGASICSMHPLQSFALVNTRENLFKNIYISMEGDKDAVIEIKKIIDDLGGISMEILTEAKSLYHAAAVGASNYLVSLLFYVQELNKMAGISSVDSFKCLKPLILGTLKNIENLGIPSALTGPIARGDKDTILTHLNEMQSKTPHLLEIYKTLGQYTVLLAKTKGTITDNIADELISVLK